MGRLLALARTTRATLPPAETPPLRLARLLAEPLTNVQTVSPEQEEAPKETEETRGLQTAFEAARSGLMPSLTPETRVSISPGITTTEPARAFLAAYANLRGVTPDLRQKEWATLDRISAWWETRAESMNAEHETSAEKEQTTEINL